MLRIFHLALAQKPVQPYFHHFGNRTFVVAVNSFRNPCFFVVDMHIPSHLSLFTTKLVFAGHIVKFSCKDLPERSMKTGPNARRKKIVENFGKNCKKVEKFLYLCPHTSLNAYRI